MVGGEFFEFLHRLNPSPRQHPQDRLPSSHQRLVRSAGTLPPQHDMVREGQTEGSWAELEVWQVEFDTLGRTHSRRQMVCEQGFALEAPNGRHPAFRAM